MSIPDHNPTLKIPSTASQELREIAKKERSRNNELLFILLGFRNLCKNLTLRLNNTVNELAPLQEVQPRKSASNKYYINKLY